MQTKIKINLPGNLFNKTSLNFDFCPPKDTKKMASNIHTQSEAVLSQLGHHINRSAPPQ